jgi:hypothetical protein
VLYSKKRHFISSAGAKSGLIFEFEGDTQRFNGGTSDNLKLSIPGKN